VRRKDHCGPTIRMLSQFSIKNSLLFLSFVVLVFLLIHGFDSIGNDIGRHLKLGEIISQTKSVPDTNLFSYSEPDRPFVNHHWLSEVVFFGIFSVAGFSGLIISKAILVVLAFVIIFSSIREKRFWPSIIAFFIAVSIFLERTEMRPEIFSFVILSFYLFALFRAKYHNNYYFIWFLPILQLFWVNLHIYFFIGPLLLLLFFIDRLANKRKIRSLLLVGGLIGFATLINPAGLKGALLPFNIFKEYGYDVVENQSLAFLKDFITFNVSITLFKISVGLLIASFILTFKNIRDRIFELLISIFFIYAGFKMLRNLPLYAIGSMPVLTILWSDIQNTLESKFEALKGYNARVISNISVVVMAILLIVVIFLIPSGKLYSFIGSNKAFGLSVSNSYHRATDFVKNNNISGPVFNNFDIGGFLVWQLYPSQKVFVDNRPEAYSVKFFDEIYKPMQSDESKWNELSDKYDINYIFFSHKDITPWAQTFLGNIIKNKDWPVIYLNEEVIILIQRVDKNKDTISKYEINEANAVEKIIDELESSNNDMIFNLLRMGRFTYFVKWQDTAMHFNKKVLKIDPDSIDALLSLGLMHAYYTDQENQELALEYIEKAISLGLENAQYYAILGVINMNLQRLLEAEYMFKKALDLDPDNENAKEFLEKYFK
jgi:hypothetical protein